MKIDLSCPVEVWEATCPSPEREACELKLFNLTDKSVTSVEINAFTKDRNDRELQHIIHRCYSLHGRPHSVFDAIVAMEHDPAAVGTEATITKVWFDDNTVWRKSRDPLAEYTPNRLTPSKDLDMLQYVAGPTAIGFPEEQEQAWLCICGRPNSLLSGVCARCGQSKQRIFEMYSRENIRNLYDRKEHQLDLKSRAVREDNARIQLEREEEYNKKTAKETGDRRLLRGFALAVVFAVLIFGAGIPALRYGSALYGMEHGHAAEAEQVLTELRAFPGAAANLARCRSLRAEQALGSGDPEKLAEAADIFRQDGSEEAAGMARTADYERAVLLMEQNDPAGARELFRALGDHEDSRELANECTYRVASGYFESHFYEMALNEFNTLGEYKDSAEKRNLCIYLPAVELMENGEYNAAIAEFGRIPDYGDTQQQIRICNWLKGASLETSDPATAAEAYAEAGDYEDGTKKAKALWYAMAADAETAGDLAGASELYYRAVPLDDSLNRAYTCVYTMAEQKLSAGEYEAARELYSTLPDNYRETGDRKAETWYRPAVEAQKSSDWKTAVGLYEKCGSYSDSISRLEKCRYELATNLQKEGSYDAAIPLFEQLGEYSDSAKQLNNCRYDLAVQSMQDGDAAKAAELFTILGTYKDSSVRLKEATAALQSVPAPEEEKTDESDFAVEDE